MKQEEQQPPELKLLMQKKISHDGSKKQFLLMSHLKEQRLLKMKKNS